MWLNDLSNLVIPHSVVRGAPRQWMLSVAGIWIIDNGQQQPPRGTPGEPVTVRRIWSWWGDAIRRECRRYGVPVELVVATLAAETASSTSDPVTAARAVRCESGYINDDATPHRVSIGCMQTLLTTARIALARQDLSRQDLMIPEVSIAAGTAYIAQHAVLTKLDPPQVAASYNAGGVYPEPIAYNPWGMRCYPLLSGRYVSSWVAWFNDAMHLPTALAEAANAPSFVSAMRPAPAAEPKVLSETDRLKLDEITSGTEALKRKEPRMTSPAGAAIYAMLTDKNGDRFKLAPSATLGSQIAINDKLDPVTANVVGIWIGADGLCHQFNTDGDQWYYDKAQSAPWVEVKSSTAMPLGKKAARILPGGAWFEDAAGNQWSLAANGNPVINGLTDTPSHAQFLELWGATVWQCDLGNQWYSITPSAKITSAVNVPWAGPVPASGQPGPTQPTTQVVASVPATPSSDARPQAAAR